MTGITTRKSNTEIILLAFELFEAQQTTDGSEQRFAQRCKDGEINDDDLSLVDVVASLMHGVPMQGGSVLADRAREIAREMLAPIIEGEDGWFRMGPPDLKAGTTNQARAT